MGHSSGRNMGLATKLRNARRDKRISDLRCAALAEQNAMLRAERDMAMQRVAAGLAALEWCAGGYRVREGAVPEHLERAMKSLRALPCCCGSTGGCVR